MYNLMTAFLMNSISILLSGFLGYKAYVEGYEPYRRIETAWFLSAMLDSIVEGVMLTSQSESIAEIAWITLLLILFLNISILLHYITILIYGFVNILWAIPMYIPPTFLTILLFTVDLDLATIKVRNIYGEEFTIGTWGKFQVPLKILHVIYGFIIYLTLFRGIFKEHGERRKGYIALLLSILPLNIGVVGFRLLYPDVGIYKVCSYSTLAIPSLIILYSAPRTPSFPEMVWARSKIVDAEVEPGTSYLIEDAGRVRSLMLFKTLLNNGLEGLCISRLTPKISVERYGTSNVVWISTLETEHSIHPTHLARIKNIIESFLKAGGRVVMLDNIESLILFNGFEETIKFLNSIADLAIKYKSVVLIPIDPKTVPGMKLTMMKKFFKRL